MVGRRPLLLGAVASVLATPAWGQANPFGDWYGALEVGAVRLRLRLRIASGPVVTLYSIDQGNGAVPADQARIDGDEITARFSPINASFEGRLVGGRIEGTFTQGAPLPLVLGREPIGDPPAVLPPAAVLTQDGLAALRTAVGSPGVGAAAKRGDRALALADGARALGRPERVTTSDRWHLGSITKSMTATLVARAVERGAVAWNDSIGDVLGRAVPDMRDVYRSVTFRHLLSHRGGIQPGLDVPASMFPERSVDVRADRLVWARGQLHQAPVGAAETTFAYANGGYVIAGAMLETRMGAPWEELMREHVFAPLGLESAGFSTPGTPGAYDQPVGHGGEGGRALTPYPPGAAGGDLPAAIGPAGLVHMSLDDLLTYLAAHRDRTLFLRAENWDMLHTPPFGGDYALGWVRRGDAFWHNGSNGRWYAEMTFDRASGLVAATAVNDGRVAQVEPAVSRALQCAGLAVRD